MQNMGKNGLLIPALLLAACRAKWQHGLATTNGTLVMALSFIDPRNRELITDSAVKVAMRGHGGFVFKFPPVWVALD
ncbi:hypothetical protein [Microbulbifer sp. SAOS-129_SWC]|uniref:hypothetical protein n=1 Tax=Microbulbifer sp. SAOS-129_SWC TaxID=3145235 RepID=UPI003217B5A2